MCKNMLVSNPVTVNIYDTGHCLLITASYICVMNICLLANKYSSRSMTTAVFVSLCYFQFVVFILTNTVRVMHSTTAKTVPHTPPLVIHLPLVVSSAARTALLISHCQGLDVAGVESL